MSELPVCTRLLRDNGDRVIEGAALGHFSKLALWQGDETLARPAALLRTAWAGSGPLPR